MTHEQKSLDDYSSFETPVKVKLSDNSVLNAYGKGKVHLTILNGNEKVNIVLTDVLFVPKLQSKLFSLPVITEKGVAVEFKDKACGITLDGKQYTIGYKHGKLYKLNTSTSEEMYCIGNTSKQELIELWHQRYGHLGYDNLNILNDKTMVNGTKYVNYERVFMA